MKKVYYLSSCSTCKRILSEIDINDFELQDIKSEPISDSQINEMAKLSGSFESLFSRKAVLYREMKLSEKNLTEKEYRGLILENYTFLKRPVFIIGNQIFIGNTKKVIEELKVLL